MWYVIFNNSSVELQKNNVPAIQHTSMKTKLAVDKTNFFSGHEKMWSGNETIAYIDSAVLFL